MVLALDYINIKFSLFGFTFDSIFLGVTVWRKSFNNGSCIICITVLWLSFNKMDLRRKMHYPILKFYLRMYFIIRLYGIVLLLLGR